MPVVAKAHDGLLNDISAMFTTPEHAIAALDAARGGPVAEGSVGGSNGMMAYVFKGGTGTSSREVAIGGDAYVARALVLANHGIRTWFNTLGKPVGRLLAEGRLQEGEMCSIIVIIGTDAQLSALALRHVAKRATIGIGRNGTPGGKSSGDIFPWGNPHRPCSADPNSA